MASCNQSHMATNSTTVIENGARPLKSLQDGAASGPVPRRDPPSATGGPSRSSCSARGRGRNATGSTSSQRSTTQRQQFTVMQWNAESVTNKKAELENLLHERNISICCIQETHLQTKEPKDKQRSKPDPIHFKIRGYKCLRADREGRSKGGILTLVRNNIQALETSRHMEDSEYQTILVQAKSINFELVNFYCPNDKPLSLNRISNKGSNLLVVGDFNSHSQSWGYDHMDARGEEVENWQDDNQLILLNHPADQATFYSRRWHTTSTPDLAFCTEELQKITTREVGDQLGGSDHRPVFLHLGIEPQEDRHLPRWNYKKANWALYRHRTSELCKDIVVIERDINNVVADFNSAILKAAHETIPRGCRKKYKPYWNKDLQELDKALSEARNKAENNPSLENNNKLQQAKAKFLKHKQQERRKTWREKTRSLNFEKDSRKLWKLTKQLNDESSGRAKTALEENGRILPGKETANAFATSFENDCNLTVTPEQQQTVRQELRKEQNKGPEGRHMEQPLTLHELHQALRKLKMKKAQGPDNISNEMLTNLGSAAVHKLLEIFNKSWSKGLVPQIWREATMIPIHKKGKDPKKASNYRPISLTSCVVKTMERIVNERLRWHLESNNLLAPEQAGFRQFRCTEDQATYLSQEIEDAFQEQKSTLVAWIDLQKAFDKVWKEGLLLKLNNCGISSHMYQWIKAYLHNRRARVNVDQDSSRKVLLRHGVPQGGVISPTLFLVFINDVVAELPKGIKAALYADDLVLWSTEEYATTATYRMQLAADKLNSWANKWCVTINKDKSSTTLFTLSTKQKGGTISLGGTPLREDEEATYLGVTFDKRQTWKPHITKAEGRARRKLAILRKLAGTTWGANERILRSVYQGTVRPHLEYASTAWSNASKTNLQTLDRVQNQALRLITGAMRSTPIREMERQTSIQPLGKRREGKIFMQAEKFKSLPCHPMKQKIEGHTKNRLKRSSFVHESKRLIRQHSQTVPVESAPVITPSLHIQDINCPNVEPRISGNVPGVTTGENQPDVTRRSLTLAMMDDYYPSEAWIHVYTDGSATNAVTNGGAGILINFPDGQSTSMSGPTGKFCTNYRAESEALGKAASAVRDSLNPCKQVVFFTDALSVLQALQNDKLPQLSNVLREVSKIRRTTLQWIPAHCGIPGNERADTLAKEGAGAAQPENCLNYQEKKTLIKALHHPEKPRDDYHLLSREQQVALFRLRTGHNRLNAHMNRKFKLAASPLCACGEEDQTTEHILQRCRLFKANRLETWPTVIPLQTKLYGSKVDLEKTVSFIADCNLTL